MAIAVCVPRGYVRDEQPPSQPNGGGFNSTMEAGAVTVATPLANGATIDLRFLFGIQQIGNYPAAAIDAASNPNLASTSTDNSVTFGVVAATVTPVPTLSESAIIALSLMLLAFGVRARRRG